LEARLSAVLALGNAESEERKTESPGTTVAEATETDAVAVGGLSTAVLAQNEGRRPETENDAPSGLNPPGSVEPPLPGEEAEGAFLAEARERGEDVASVAAALAAAESEDDKSALPPLEELVQKLPAELRDTLDDLFRARFVKVIRVRKKDLPA
jgi:hypothetical protein